MTINETCKGCGTVYVDIPGCHLKDCLAEKLKLSNLKNEQMLKKMRQWECIVAAALAWDAYDKQDRFLERMSDAINAYRADKLPEPTDVDRLIESLKIECREMRRLLEVTNMYHCGETCGATEKDHNDDCLLAQEYIRQQKEKRKCVPECQDRHFCNAPKLHEGGCHCQLDG